MHRKMKGRAKTFSVGARSRVQRSVPKLAARGLPAFVIAFAVTLVACGRSQLLLAPAPRVAVGDAAVAVDLAPDLAPDLPAEVPPDAPLDLPREQAPDAPAPPKPDAGPVCHPQPEICNGIDDDCNGVVDDGLPPIPCPNGGARYCVAGAYSACPRRCEVCVPGSERECFTTFCSFWGTQACASDGRSFGPCKEALPPDDCGAITDQSKYTSDLEKCCIAQGLCCLDEFDLNGNGDKTEMLGRCDSVMCGP
jgi:hypothetical protein